MANAVGRVASTATSFDDTAEYRVPAAVAQTWYPGAMVSLNAAGNAVKGDDTAGTQFWGLNGNSNNLTVNSDDTIVTMALDQSKQIRVKRPWRFTMPIAAAAAGDEGKPLFAVDDAHVGYTSTNLVFVGFVDQVLSATSVLIRPWWVEGPPPGYQPGAGGAVTQITSSATGVTLSKLCGQITTVALTTAAAAEERFTVTNTLVAATDVIALSTTYNGAGTPMLGVCNVAAGAFDVVVTNLHAANAFNALMVINFAVIKGRAA